MPDMPRMRFQEVDGDDNDKLFGQKLAELRAIALRVDQRLTVRAWGAEVTKDQDQVQAKVFSYDFMLGDISVARIQPQIALNANEVYRLLYEGIRQLHGSSIQL